MKDLIRDNSPSAFNKRIDEETLRNLERYKDAAPAEIEARLKFLETRYDIECFVEAGAALLTLGGLLLGLKNRKFLALPFLAQGLLLSHTLPYPDPVTPVLRSFGLWSRQEIERERNALKLLRGDYERVASDHTVKSALAAAQGDKGIKEATTTTARAGVKAARKSRAKAKAIGPSENPDLQH